MTEPLVTTEELASLAELAELGMLTPVLIYARTTVRNYATGWDDSSGTSEQYATTPVSVNGWVRSRPDPNTDDDLSVIEHVEDVRLFLPLGTVTQRGDKVVIAGVEYAIIDDNAENTYRVLHRVALRRIS
jgi:hypothetical protein